MVHPEYDNDWVKYDYAIIRLDREIVFSPVANAACLPTFTDPSTTDGKSMVISGWGRVESNSDTDYTLATILQTANALGYSYEDCCNSWFSQNDGCAEPELAKEWVGPDVLCAGNITHEVTNPVKAWACRNIIFTWDIVPDTRVKSLFESWGTTFLPD